MRYGLALFILLLGLKVEAKTTISYSEAADVFEIMDHVSEAAPQALGPYKKAWLAQNGNFSSEDEALLSEYRELRKRYLKAQNKSQDESSLFVTYSISQDIVAEAFYSSKSVGQALKKLQRSLKPAEIKFLSQFYKHFRTRISQLVRESTAFNGQAKEWQKQLGKGKFNSLVKKAAQFYGLKLNRKNELRLVFVWWPKEEEHRLDHYGQTLFIRRHPLTPETGIEASEILRRIVLIMSYRQNENDKRNMSQIFLAQCQLPKGLVNESGLALPLAEVFANHMYRAAKDRKNFNLAQQTSLNPWVDVYSKVLYSFMQEQLKHKLVMGSDFVLNAGRLCASILKSHAFLKTLD